MSSTKLLTPKQKEVYDFMKSFHESHGFSPSIREVQHAFSLSSVASAFKLIKKLEEKGVIEKKQGSWRSFFCKPEEKDRLAHSGKELPLIGALSKGKKIELFQQVSHFSFPSSLVDSEQSAYAFIVKDQSFEEQGIFEGDILAISLTFTAKTGDVVLATDDERAFLGKYEKKAGSISIQNDLFSEEKIRLRGKLICLIRSWQAAN